MRACGVCGETYDLGVRSWFVDGKMVCEHDPVGVGPGKFAENYSSKFGKQQRLERGKHAKDILQPYDRHGRVNNNFVQAYGKNNQAYKKSNADTKTTKVG